MRIEILKFIEEVKSLYKLEARYFPANDVYSLMKNGKGVQNFNSINFYQLPKSYRKAQIRGIINLGLTHNMGEKTKEQIHLNRSIGRNI